MNRYDAHLIAEELLKLAPHDYTHDEYLSPEGIAKRLNVSASWVYHQGESLPRMKVGGSWRYSLNEVVNFLKKQ